MIDIFPSITTLFFLIESNYFKIEFLKSKHLNLKPSRKFSLSLYFDFQVVFILKKSKYVDSFEILELKTHQLDKYYYT